MDGRSQAQGGVSKNGGPAWNRKQIIWALAASACLGIYLITYFAFVSPYYGYVDYTNYEDTQLLGARLNFSHTPAPYPPQVAIEAGTPGGNMHMKIDRVTLAKFEKENEAWLKDGHELNGIFSIYIPIHYLDRKVLRRDYWRENQ